MALWQLKHRLLSAAKEVSRLPSPQIIRAARLRLLRMHYEAGVGHIGGNLSALDILLTLYHDVLKPDDRFVLSKGHAAGAIYVALA
ncbi:MAG: hypothetical protein JO353_11780, partial [Phycisphaerae bacterium]|nr:hypothetical protein [Phycisphaerae bacterium]